MLTLSNVLSTILTLASILTIDNCKLAAILKHLIHLHWQKWECNLSFPSAFVSNHSLNTLHPVHLRLHLLTLLFCKSINLLAQEQRKIKRNKAAPWWWQAATAADWSPGAPEHHFPSTFQKGREFWTPRFTLMLGDFSWTMKLLKNKSLGLGI